MIDHKNKFVFIHIPKTGGTSIEKYWIESADSTDVKLKHKPLKLLMKKFPDACVDYFKFTFVRNPWDWLVSRYIWSRNHQDLFTYEFDEFLWRIERGKILSWNALWLQRSLKPQVTWITLKGEIAVDFVGRYERLQEDFEHICQRLEVEPITLPHIFKTKRKHYSQYYNDKQQNVVRKLYRADIEAFGYQFERASSSTDGSH